MLRTFRYVAMIKWRKSVVVCLQCLRIQNGKDADANGACSPSTTECTIEGGTCKAFCEPNEQTVPNICHTSSCSCCINPANPQCEYDEEAWKKYTFDDLRQIHKSEDSSSFLDAVDKMYGDQSPTIEDMPGISNDWINGEFPQYLSGRDFKHIFNRTGNYSYSNSNAGTFSSVLYGLQEGNVSSNGTISLFQIDDIKGAFGEYEYMAGSAFSGKIKYCKNGDSVSFHGVIKGTFFTKNSSGFYIKDNEFYSATSKGKIDLGTQSEHSLQTLAITNRESKYSKSVINGKEDNFEGNYDMQTLDGGPEVTMDDFITFFEGNEVHNDIQYKIQYPSAAITGNGYAKTSFANDKFLDQDTTEHLISFFIDTYITATVYG